MKDLQDYFQPTIQSAQKRSASFHSDPNSSMPFSSMAMSRESFQAYKKRGGKFNFLKKIRGNNKKLGNYGELPE